MYIPFVIFKSLVERSCTLYGVLFFSSQNYIHVWSIERAFVPIGLLFYYCRIGIAFVSIKYASAVAKFSQIVTLGKFVIQLVT